MPAPVVWRGQSLDDAMRRHGSDEHGTAQGGANLWHVANGKGSALLKHSPKSTEDRNKTMANPQLRLVQDAQQPQTSTDSVRRVFEHWLFMLGRSPRRCKLGPTRRAAINGALAIGYDEETLMLACEGMACVSFEGKPESMREAMLELEWFMAREARIERATRYNKALRDAAARQAVPVAVAEAVAATVDPVAAAAARERLRTMAAALRGGAHG
jgi:hypothetical protein